MESIMIRQLGSRPGGEGGIAQSGRDGVYLGMKTKNERDWDRKAGPRGK